MTSMSEVEVEMGREQEVEVDVEMKSDVGREVEDVSIEASESDSGDIGDFIVTGMGEIGDSGDGDSVVDIGESCNVIGVDTSVIGVDIDDSSCNNARLDATSD